MLSVAFKNLITPKRSTWRSIMATKSDSLSVEQYKAYIEGKLQAECMSIVDLVSNHVLVNVEAHKQKHMLHFDEGSIEERAFFYKIVGDYYRYASEATTMTDTPTKEKLKKGALESYQKCSNISKKGLKPYNTVRLGLALNFSVFQYEIMQNPSEACKIAQDSLS